MGFLDGGIPFFKKYLQNLISYAILKSNKLGFFIFSEDVFYFGMLLYGRNLPITFSIEH